MTKGQMRKATILGKLMSHPLRLEFLRQADTRNGEGLTAAEFAREQGEGISNVNYHVGEMRKLGAVGYKQVDPLYAKRAAAYEIKPLGREVITIVGKLKGVAPRSL